MSEEPEPESVDRSERVPKSYIARILASVWLCSAALYGTSKVDVMSKTQSHIAMACYVVLALVLLLRPPVFRRWL